MKLSVARENYYCHSAAASAAARQLAFAGIAAVWVFNQPQDQPGIALPQVLTWAMILLCFSLACDLLQYASSSAIWGYFHRIKEKELAARSITADANVAASRWFNWPGIVFYWSKLALIISAYACIAAFLFSHLSATA
ncbi:hypothetical protein HMPREF3113_06020 [Stenotrophomonas sp. HMSC10F06]|jgi:hypothetical protein|uniref:hypothetical protein n=1 Tax=Stenotrophomonas sp. HMSC10F06 TaxID=1581081 RepID=UPI0008A17BD6|nr:hypothetical protein [Stenotrophomonas sp. HMSC10F06]OFS95162.1 hypothetical protein HMPREF3113_06020 [Stenotrophomonas sp. HMSC10F06]HEL3872932.1 hypothetical protein [Stenotrophomonas maltophilia]